MHVGWLILYVLAACLAVKSLWSLLETEALARIDAADRANSHSPR